MAAWEALKGLTAQLSSVSTAEDIGQALLALGKRFGLTNLLILDATKLFSRVGPAIVYASADRQEIEAFDTERPFVSGPAYLRAQASDRPFLMSDVRRALAQADHKEWWFSLSGDKKHKDGLVIPIHVDGALVWGRPSPGRIRNWCNRCSRFSAQRSTRRSRAFANFWIRTGGSVR